MPERIIGSSIAHIRKDEYGIDEYQSVTEHSTATAKLTSKQLQCVGLANTGKFVGMLHDMGKCKQVSPRTRGAD